MPLANYTTVVPASRSVSLIQEMLARSGVSAMMLEYSAKGEPCAVSFRIKRMATEIAFRLPVDQQGVERVLARQKISPRLKTPEHARRVAWRTLHDWLRAQLAMVEVGNAPVEQMMMAYAVLPSGETVYEQLKSSGFNTLAISEKSQS